MKLLMHPDADVRKNALFSLQKIMANKTSVPNTHNTSTQHQQDVADTCTVSTRACEATVPCVWIHTQAPTALLHQHKHKHTFLASTHKQENGE